MLYYFTLFSIAFVTTPQKNELACDRYKSNLLSYSILKTLSEHKPGVRVQAR